MFKAVKVILCGIGLTAAVAAAFHKDMGFNTAPRVPLLISPHPGFNYTMRPGEKISIPFDVTNEDVSPIRLLGVETSCNCLVVSGLPMALKAGEHGEINVSFSVSKDAPSANSLKDSVYIRIRLVLVHYFLLMRMSLRKS